MTEIQVSYCLDDSCQMQLWAHGHHSWGDFMDAVETHLKREDRGDIPRWVITQAPVKNLYQRKVPCRDSIVSDTQLVLADKPGRGASPVTVLDFWFPLHRPYQQDADKVDATLWQPIETAPKDGTPLLLFARAASATASIDMFGWWLEGRGWIAQSLCGQDIVDIVPSHWMPRPPFPCESRAQQGGQS